MVEDPVIGREYEWHHKGRDPVRVRLEEELPDSGSHVWRNPGDFGVRAWPSVGDRPGGIFVATVILDDGPNGQIRVSKEELNEISM